MSRHLRIFTNPRRKLADDQSGAAAVEMALLAGPFFFVLIAIAEVALIATVQANLDLAMGETARRIRTGEVQTAGLTANDVRREVCGRINRIMPLDCNANLYIDVDRFEAFVEVNDPSPIRNGDIDEDDFGFDPGAPSDIVLARAFYRWEVFTPFFGDIFGNIGAGKRLISSAILFRNEPFPEQP